VAAQVHLALTARQVSAQGGCERLPPRTVLQRQLGLWDIKAMSADMNDGDGSEQSLGSVAGPATGRSWLGRPAVTGVVGLVVGAALTAASLGLSGSASGGSKGRSLTAPSSLGGLLQFERAMVQLDGSKVQAQAAQMTVQDGRSAQRLSQAYGGAHALVQRYSDSQLDNISVLDAVSAASPQPYVPYEDVKEERAAVPINQLLQFGQVTCVVVNPFTAAGHQPDPESVTVTYCQRTGPGLTVQFHPGPTDLWHKPAQVAALVDKAWSELS
jgi:hypothetical protein